MPRSLPFQGVPAYMKIILFLAIVSLSGVGQSNKVMGLAIEVLFLLTVWPNVKKIVSPSAQRP